MICDLRSHCLPLGLGNTTWFLMQRARRAGTLILRSWFFDFTLFAHISLAATISSGVATGTDSYIFQTLSQPLDLKNDNIRASK